MTRQDAERQIAPLGFTLDDAAGKSPGLGWSATIDPVGRVSISGDCRGIAVVDGAASASDFWALVVSEAREAAPYLGPCPCPPGDCDFHDVEEEPRP